VLSDILVAIEIHWDSDLCHYRRVTRCPPGTRHKLPMTPIHGDQRTPFQSECRAGSYESAEMSVRQPCPCSILILCQFTACDGQADESSSSSASASSLLDSDSGLPYIRFGGIHTVVTTV